MKGRRAAGDGLSLLLVVRRRDGVERFPGWQAAGAGASHDPTFSLAPVKSCVSQLTGRGKRLIVS